MDTAVFLRENPIRDVTHYESPPRRRLREQEDEVLKTYYESKLSTHFYKFSSFHNFSQILTQKLALSPEKDIKDIDPIGTVDRLMLSEKEKQMRLGYLRKKKMLDQVSEMQDKPKITSHPIHDEPKVLIHLRKKEPKQFDQELEDKRRQNPNREVDEYGECTFKPNLNSNRGNGGRERSIDDLLQWNNDRRFKLAN